MSITKKKGLYSFTYSLLKQKPLFSGKVSLQVALGDIWGISEL